MSIAILSIPLGIIAIIGFIWSINSMSEKPAKGRKKDNDAALIGIIASVVLFFVALGIYDGIGSTAGLFGSDNAVQEQGAQSGTRNSSKSQAQREVEEANRAAVEKARSQAETENDSNSKGSNKSDSGTNVKDTNDTSKVKSVNQKKYSEKQQKAFQDWKQKIEAKIQSAETTWSALWTDGSPESIGKLEKAFETTKEQLEDIKVPSELPAAHRQILSEAVNRYAQWLDSHRQACQMKLANGSQQDISNELARGDGLKLRSNVEIANVGRDLGLSD